jgi:hypothetical protein
MGLFNRRKKKSKKENAALQHDELIAVLGAAVAAASDEGERIAVIAAALAAYEDDSATSNLHIKKIDRTAGVIPAWGVMGNREQIRQRSHNRNY